MNFCYNCYRSDKDFPDSGKRHVLELTINFIYIQLSLKLFIPIPNSEYFQLFYLRTNFTVAEISEEYDERVI